MTSYHGGKQRIGKKIAESIYNIDTENIKGYCEPFCGMLGVYQHIPELFAECKLKYKAGDYNESVIKMWKKAQTGWIPPTKCTKTKYEELRHNGDSSAEKGFIGHQYSYGGQYFIGFRGSYNNKSAFEEASKNVSKITTLPGINKCIFTAGEYTQFTKLKNYIIYCDPPYKKDNRYYEEDGKKIYFDSDLFWDWCRYMSKNNIVFVSEYSVPKRIKTKIIYLNKHKITGKSPKKEERERTEKLFLVL